MNKSTTTAVTGVAMAALAGTAAYMLSHRKATPGKKLKQNTAKASVRLAACWIVLKQ